MRRRSISASASAAVGTSTLNGSVTSPSPLAFPALVRYVQPRLTDCTTAPGAGSRLGAVPTFRYVVVDVFTDTPSPGNQLAVFTDAREIPEEWLQPLAREMNLSETVFVYPTEADGHARIRIFTPGDRAAVRRAPDARHGVRARRADAARRDPARDRRGVVPVRSNARARGSCSGAWRSRSRPSRRSSDADAAARCARRRRSELPVEVYDNGLPHVFVMLGSPAEVAALSPIVGALAELGSARDQLLRRRGRGAGRRGCSCRRAASPRIRRPARRPAARAPPRAARPDRVRRGDRDHPGRRDRPTVDALCAGRRQRGRSRAGRGRRLARSSSRAASSGSSEANASGPDLGQLDREPVPEAAAVGER